MAASRFFILLAFLLPAFNFAVARVLTPAPESPTVFKFKYHNGKLLTGRVAVNLIWYGRFKPSQKAVVADFIAAVQSPPSDQAQPSAATWWRTAQSYYYNGRGGASVSFYLGKQVSDENCSLGKSLTARQLRRLAVTHAGDRPNSINVVLTSSDVAVEGFCSSRCGTHGAVSGGRKNKNLQIPYIWVGNSETQCPGQCAWPFHRPIYGPQTPPLVAPNNDVGVDGMVVTLAGLLAGTATNPFGDGYYQGPPEAPLEASSACPGIFGKGAYPGYAGELLKDPATGGSYNAHGVKGRRHLLPALYNPTTKSCFTLT
ncbi:protein PHOSPHATE-INDUCED 1-like [Andrographis paniculata]|uniref:protein PHOSPHATE-INDUCED 1-like n=1 Tax=Andrographis paniculata TaxID=175694 RepID=UPI0021E99020|nr:protein PHOSPHATE-INDUCED 1-like [Andrographis paniculata]